MKTAVSQAADAVGKAVACTLAPDFGFIDRPHSERFGDAGQYEVLSTDRLSPDEQRQ